MKNEIEAMITDITATTAEAEDYTGEDGLLVISCTHILLLMLSTTVMFCRLESIISTPLRKKTV